MEKRQPLSVLSLQSRDEERKRSVAVCATIPSCCGSAIALDGSGILAGMPEPLSIDKIILHIHCMIRSVLNVELPGQTEMHRDIAETTTIHASRAGTPPQIAL